MRSKEALGDNKGWGDLRPETGKESSENVYDIPSQRVVMQIAEVQTHLGREQNLYIEAFWVVGGLQEGFFMAKSQGGRAGNARAELQNSAVWALEAVGEARDIRTGANQAHFAPQNIP